MASDLKLGMKCIKYMLFAVNLTFVLTSMLLITSGGTIHAIYSDFRHFLSEAWFSPATIMIAVGVLMFFISAFGCWGAIKESTCMINTFGAMLAAIFIIEFGGAIAAFACQSQIAGIIRSKMEFAVHNFDQASTERQEAVNFLQDRLFCCGVDGPSDWSQSNFTIPKSCCNRRYESARMFDGDQMRLSSALQFQDGVPVYPSDVEALNYIQSEETRQRREAPQEQQTTVGQSTAEDSATTAAPGTTSEATETCEPHASGCYKKLAFLIGSSAAILGSGAVTVALMQLLGMMCAFSLARAIRKAKTQRLMRQNWQQRMGQIIGMQATPYTQLQEKRGAEVAPVTYAPSDPSVL